MVIYPSRAHQPHCLHSIPLPAAGAELPAGPGCSPGCRSKTRDFHPSNALEAAGRSRKSPVGGLGSVWGCSSHSRMGGGFQLGKEQSWSRGGSQAPSAPLLGLSLSVISPKSLLSLRRTQGMELRCCPRSQTWFGVKVQPGRVTFPDSQFPLKALGINKVSFLTALGWMDPPLPSFPSL